MLKPVCLNIEHEILLNDYLKSIDLYIEDVTSTKEKYEDFLEISNIIIEHHNNYQSNNLGHANYSDFMSIIPTHFSCMVNGYFIKDSDFWFFIIFLKQYSTHWLNIEVEAKDNFFAVVVVCFFNIYTP